MYNFVDSAVTHSNSDDREENGLKLPGSGILSHPHQPMMPIAGRRPSAVGLLPEKSEPSEKGPSSFLNGHRPAFLGDGEEEKVENSFHSYSCCSPFHTL